MEGKIFQKNKLGLFMVFRKIKELLKPSGEKVIIVGAGEVGLHLAERLSMEGKSVVVIDIDAGRLDRVTQSVDVQTILGSGSSPSHLLEAGIANAKYFMAVTNSDEVNLVACLFANHLAPDAVNLARIHNSEYGDHPDVLGSTNLNIQLMVHPEYEIVQSIDRLLSLPGSQDYAQFAGGRLRMVAYHVEHGVLIGKQLTEFRTLAKDDNIMVAAIVRNKELIIPTGQDIIQEGDLVYFAYQVSSQRALLRLLERTRAFFSSVCIVGGGKIGVSLAQLFEKKGFDVKLIEKNQARCEELAEILDDTLILHGDATEKTLLMEENVGKMDVVIAVTSDEETNILSCLLAKSLGARDSVARVNKSAYMPIIKAIGIDHGVSTRIAAVNGFLNYLRKGNVVATASVAGDTAEVLEAYLSENSPLLGIPLMKLEFPSKVILLAIMRDEKVFIPNGKTVLQVSDHVIFLGEHKEIRSIDPLLGGKI